jgi:indolepyruvate ferredoxin oxidoreductase
MRRTERALVDEYRNLVSRSLEQLTPASVDIVTAVAALADEIRGYEDVKRSNIDRFRVLAAELVALLGEDSGAGRATDLGRRPIAG